MKLAIASFILLATATTAHAGAPGETAATPATTAPAATTTTAAPPVRQTLDVGVALGPGLPGGNLGLDVALRITPEFSVSAGVGIAEGGTQLSLMPRFYPGNGRLRPVLGIGISGGTYQEFCIDCHDVYKGMATWANVEGGLEFRGRERPLFVRFVVGGSVMMSHEGDLDDADSSMPYSGITVGGSF